MGILLLCLCFTNLIIIGLYSRQKFFLSELENELGINIKDFDEIQKHKMKIFIFFEPSVGESKIQEVNKEISNYRCVESIKYTSSEEAGNEYLNMYEEPYINSNTIDLPPSTEVLVREMSRCNKEKLAEQIRGNFEDEEIFLDIIYK